MTVREVKFRAWHKEHGSMATWEEINILDEDGLYPFLEMLNGKLYEVMQYTGLYDRHGDKAAHKDIVEYQGTNYLIEWWEEDTGFYLADLNHLNDLESEYHLKGQCIRESEIIGNAFEHPHLLAKEEEQT